MSPKKEYPTTVLEVNKNTFDMNIIHTNGNTSILRGEKSNNIITY